MVTPFYRDCLMLAVSSWYYRLYQRMLNILKSIRKHVLLKIY